MGDSFNMNADADVTVALNQPIDWETQYRGTEDDPYLIYLAGQWNTLATRVNNGRTYEGKYFQLIADISVSVDNMVGDEGSMDRCFSGIFDGMGHTITFDVANTIRQYIAPFRRINGATIKGIKLEGTPSRSSTCWATSFSRVRSTPHSSLTSGVYVLRLINGTDVKTQKMVIE